MPIKLLVADGDRRQLAMLEKLFSLEDGIEMVACTSSAKELLPMISEKKPQISIIDIDWLELKALGLQDIIPEAAKESKIIVQSFMDSDYMALELLKMGVSCYLLKGDPDIMLQAIKDVGQGQKCVYSPMAQEVLGKYPSRQLNSYNMARLGEVTRRRY